MNIPVVRLAVVAAIGSVALLAQAGLASVSAAVPAPGALPTSHLGVHAVVAHTPTSTRKTRPSRGSVIGHSSAPANGLGASVTGAGIKCDGTTNDTPAIQAAVNAAGRLAGGVVMISRGGLRPPGQHPPQHPARRDR